MNREVVLLTRTEQEKLRRAFRPPHVELLFIGEAPPASGRFFYCRNSGLYRAMRDAFYSIDPAIDDDNFLEVFQASGCYLTDLCSKPVDRLDTKSREAARRAGERSLSRKIAQLQPATIAPVLRSINAHVSRAASRAEWAGQMIHLPYPGRWHQHRSAFIETVAPVVRYRLERVTEVVGHARYLSARLTR